MKTHTPTILHIIALQDREARRLDETLSRIEAPQAPADPPREDHDDGSDCTTFQL